MGVTDEPSLTRRIITTLRERVVAGDMAPGSPIRQDRVAEEFGSSHVPVREAFRRLEADGLLVASPRRGVRVAPLDPGGVRETSMMRAALEALALEQAFPHLTKQEFDLAETANAACGVSREISVWIAANRDFHMALVRPCAMPRLLETIADLHRLSERYLYAAWKNLNWQPRSDQEHTQLLTLLREGNGAAATQILRRHVIAAGAALADQLGA